MARNERRQQDQAMNRTGRLLGTALALTLTAALTGACADNITSRGQIPEPEDIAQLEPGRTSKDDVLRLLGTPSHVSSFREDTWYYIGHKSEAFAFFEPEILERKVLALNFDENGTLQKTQGLELADGQDIDPIDRETPTEGRELTFLQQMLGNIGRFPGTNTGQPDF
jgi:outer membrane protein assembly factor BamE (lipoprotein component of BamABCDE complex)